MVFFSSRISPCTSTVIFFERSPVRDRGRDFRDVAHLRGQVAGHRIHRIGQILPRAGDALHFRLAAELSFRADFARHARHFRRERAELIDHRVDGVLQLQNFAFHIDGDLLGKIAVRDRRGDFRDVSHLTGQVRAMKFTESVRSFQVPETPSTRA